MELNTSIVRDSYALKITAHEDGKQVGRQYLYILRNDLHKEPFGLLEDLYVEEDYRKRGIGSELVKKAIAEAKAQGCYKLILTSRDSNSRLHAFYERLGFAKWGSEFRIDL